MTRVGWVGLGRIGVPMAAHVARAGHPLRVWNRTPGRAADLVALGAVEAATLHEAVADAEVVVLVLFGPDAVREVLPQVCAAAPAGTVVVDASTIGPHVAREAAATARAAGLSYVDAPVLGSLAPAGAGTLGVVAGGAPADYERVLPLLHLWGDPDRVRHVGAVGAGSAAKLCVNQGLGVLAAGLGESLRLGRDLGLDRGALVEVLAETTYAGYLATKRAMVDSGDHTATAFSLELMTKDLELVVGATDSGLAVTQACLDQARRALAAGHAGEDFSVITTHTADEGEADSP